jgi:hypothetical protein
LGASRSHGSGGEVGPVASAAIGGVAFRRRHVEWPVRKRCAGVVVSLELEHRLVARWSLGSLSSGPVWDVGGM